MPARVASALSRFGAGLFLLIAANAVYGQHYVPEYSRLYASVALGTSTVDDRFQGVRYDDTQWSLNVTAGYRFDWVWSIEAAVQVQDDVEARGIRGSGLDRLNFSTSIESANLRARLWFPVSDLYGLSRPLVVYGFAGVHASNIERRAIELNSATEFEENLTDYGLNVGAGVVIGIGRFHLRGSLERMDLDDSDGSIVSALLGLEFYF